MMRPVERGDTPTTADGNDVVFKEYGDARDFLIARIGDYCSYCETALHSAIAVEHVQPKSLHTDKEKTWNNFLLACPYCNSVKGDAEVIVDDYFWPDVDNTGRVFVYAMDDAPRVLKNLTPDHQAKAQRTIDLTGLDRLPGHPRYSPKDRRWQKRREVWGVAINLHKALQQSDSSDFRDSIVVNALGRGFWSVWMQVFAHDLDMRRRLIAAFPGTSKNCFNAECEAIYRPGGKL